jgi:hypothetical protein
MDMQVAALDILTTKGGFASAAARAIGEAMDLQIARSYDDLATNQKLDETRVLLESKIDGFRAELNAKIDSVRLGFEAKMDSLRMELKCDIAALEVRLEKFKSDMVRWMFAALAAQAVLVVGLVRLLVPHGS